jgi:hypothetical protein
VSGTALQDRLSDPLYITVILRLAVEQQGRLLHGELVDLEGMAQGRFGHWAALIECMRGFLERAIS